MLPPRMDQPSIHLTQDSLQAKMKTSKSSNKETSVEKAPAGKGKPTFEHKRRVATIGDSGDKIVTEHASRGRHQNLGSWADLL